MATFCLHTTAIRQLLLVQPQEQAAQTTFTESETGGSVNREVTGAGWVVQIHSPYLNREDILLFFRATVLKRCHPTAPLVFTVVLHFNTANRYILFYIPCSSDKAILHLFILMG